LKEIVSVKSSNKNSSYKTLRNISSCEGGMKRIRWKVGNVTLQKLRAIKDFRSNGFVHEASSKQETS
jgi:hypothetical protein